MNKYERRAGEIFDMAQLIIEGRPHRAMRIYCYRCGKAGTCVANSMARGAGAEEKEKRMVGRKFETMGWQVDLNRGKHFCPDCHHNTVTQERTNLMKKEDTQAAPQEATIVPMVSAGRKMQREDKRLVFEKLNEVYIDEKHGYAPPWTDEGVAKDLGVPRVWVTEVREEMFGPIASNANIDDAIKAARDLAAELKKHSEQADKLGMAANTMMKQLEAIIKAVGCR